MLPIGEIFYTLLATNSTLVTLLGGAGDTLRIYPKRLPLDPSLPAITYDLIDQERKQSHSGYSGLNQARIQVTIWGEGYDSTQAILDQVLTFIGYKSILGATRIDGILATPERENYDTDTQVDQRMIDLMIWYGEA